MRFSLSEAQAITEDIGALLDGGTVEVYAGTQPASPEDDPGGVLLWTYDLATPAGSYGSAWNLTPNGVTTAVAGATPTWARWLTSTGQTVVDTPAGTRFGGSVPLGSPIALFSSYITF